MEIVRKGPSLAHKYLALKGMLTQWSMAFQREIIVTP